MSEQRQQTIPRLGLSHATLRASVEAQLEEAGLDESAAAIASAVADAIDNNNQEILRQLRGALGGEAAPAGTP